MKLQINIVVCLSTLRFLRLEVKHVHAIFFLPKEREYFVAFLDGLNLGLILLKSFNFL